MNLKTLTLLAFVLLLGNSLEAQVNTYTTNRTSTQITPSTIATKWFNGSDSTNLGVGFGSNFQITSGQHNTSLGYLTTSSNNTGSFNTAIGSRALEKIRQSTNTALGFEAMNKSTNSSQNVAIGAFSMHDNLVSKDNVALGYQAMRRNTYGYKNTALGYRALYGNTIDSLNTVIGQFAMQNAVGTGAGSENTAIGYAAMSLGGTQAVAVGNYAGSNAYQDQSVSIGNYAQYRSSGNVTIGDSALFLGSNPTRNTAIGNGAMRNSTLQVVGGLPDAVPEENVAIGNEALHRIGGRRNVAVGNKAMHNATLAYENVAIGEESMINFTNSFLKGNTAMGDFTLPDMTAASNNTAIGHEAGKGITTGSDNTLIGADITVTTPISTNLTVIGAAVTASGSNKVIIGNPSVTSVGGYAAFTNYSDKRLKTNITYDNLLGLNFISQLQPATYTYKEDQNKVIRNGLIAQDVAEVLSSLKKEFSGIQTDENGYFSISYEKLVLPLINAHQELDKELSKLELRYQQALDRNTKLKAVLPKIDQLP